MPDGTENPLAVVQALFTRIMERVEELDTEFTSLVRKVDRLQNDTNRLVKQMDGTDKPMAERLGMVEERAENNRKDLDKITMKLDTIMTKIEQSSTRILFLMLGCVGATCLALLDFVLHAINAGGKQ